MAIDAHARHCVLGRRESVREADQSAIRMAARAPRRLLGRSR